MDFNYLEYLDFSNRSPFMIFVLIIWVLALILANIFIFGKAGEPWWKALIPFYNTYISYKIATGSGWLFVLAFIPCINFFVSIWFSYRLAKAFGYGFLFTLGLIFLNPIFSLILGFGSSRYIGPNA